MKILSFGGGVQSTALAILAAQGKIEVDAFVFCDTGFEKSIVFEFLERFTLPMLKKAGISFYTAKTEHYAGNLNGKTAFGDMLLPPFFHSDGEAAISRQPAYCSSIWKTSVFKRFCNKTFKAKSYDVLMGFSTDEKHRASRQTEIINQDFEVSQNDIFGNTSIIAKKTKRKSKKFRCYFPLLDLRLNRSDCVKLVIDTFNAPPPRSSCYFCPNHTQHEWREVMKSADREKVIKIDNQIRSSLQSTLPGVNAFMTVECKPIAECEFDEKNESIFSRLCAGGCFL